MKKYNSLTEIVADWNNDGQFTEVYALTETTDSKTLRSFYVDRTAALERMLHCIEDTECMYGAPTYRIDPIRGEDLKEELIERGAYTESDFDGFYVAEWHDNAGCYIVAIGGYYRTIEEAEKEFEWLCAKAERENEKDRHSVRVSIEKGEEVIKEREW